MRALDRVLREPLLHFLILGAVCFAIYAWGPPVGDAGPSSRQIALSLDELLQIEMQFEAQWRRPPSAAELERLVDDRVQEEVLYREALLLGLDKDDTIVKRRMAQKMRFLAEDVAAAREPTTDELRAWFEIHPDKFALPGRVTFRQLYFSPDRRGARAHEDAAEALAALAGQPVDSPRAGGLGDSSMLQEYYGDRTAERLAKDFGPQFAETVVGLPPGSWQGPIESGFGWHLVFVDSFVPGRVPAFEEVEGDVKTAWLADQKAEAWSKAYTDMRARYSVLMPVPVAATSPGITPSGPAAGVQTPPSEATPE